MLRRLTFTLLFYSVFMLTGFAQQVVTVKQAQNWINSNGNATSQVYGFYRDAAGNFYTEMHMGGFLGGGTIPANFFGTVVQPPAGSGTFKILGKFDSNLNLIWAKPFRISPLPYLIHVRETITVDKAGSVYYLHTDTTYKFSSNGNLVWKKPYSGFDIRTNKQGLIDIYRFKNATNTLNGSPILNREGTVATFDTAGNYVRHFTMHNPSYQSQIVFGKNNTGYYGVRVSARPSGYIGPVRHELFTTDSLGNTLKAGRFNYNYYSNGGGTSNTGLIQTGYDPDFDEYYLVAINRAVDPINRADSSAGKPQQLGLIKLNGNLQVTGTLPLGPQKPTGLGGYPFYLRPHKGNLFFTSRTEWTTVTYYSHLGILHPHGQTNDQTLVGKLDRNLNVAWFMNLGDDNIERPIPTDNGIYYAGYSHDFKTKYLNFNADGYSDAFLIKVLDKDSTTAELSGRIFHDLNQNGLDDNEPGVMGQSVASNTVSGIAYSTGNGFYRTTAVTGQNTLQAGLLPKYWVRTSPATLQVNVPATAAQLGGFNFGVRELTGVKDALVNLTPMTAARINQPVMYQVTYRNGATALLNGQVKLVKAPELVYQNASVIPDQISGDTLIWNYQNLKPLETRQMQVKFTLPNNPALNNRHLLLEARITPLAGDTARDNNFSETYHRITGPYDPNDLAVTPACSIDRPFITDGNYLEYRVRFQNIGTDTAFSVVVHDSLSSHLDLSTLELVASSHAPQLSLKDNVLTAYFEHIKLPHAAVNYYGSHGFFTFRVKPKSMTPVFVAIKNRAAIYFDFNPPIVTNQVVTNVTSYIVPFTTTLQHLVCNGAGTGQITVNNTCVDAPVQYSLDSLTFQDSPVFSGLAAGNHSVFIKAGRKNYKLSNVILQEPTPITASFTLIHSRFNNGEIWVTGSGGNGPYIYMLNNYPAQQTSGYFNGLGAGTYQVHIRDQNNCTQTFNVVINNVSGVPEADIAGLNVYPNPFREELTVAMNSIPKGAHLQLFNAFSQLMLQQPVTTAQTQLLLGNLPAGVYLLKITTAHGYTIRKLIKE